MSQRGQLGEQIAIRLQSAELNNLSRNMQELRRMQREQALQFFQQLINSLSIAQGTRILGATRSTALYVGMAQHQHQPANELQHLRTEAAQTRLRAIRSQIGAGLTFDRVAEIGSRN